MDLLVVYNGRKREKAFAKVRSILDIPHLEPHVYSQREYQAVQETLTR